MVEKKSIGTEHDFKDLEEDFSDINRHFDGLEEVVEKLDNSQMKNNVKIKDLNERVEGEDLSGY